MLGFTRFCKLGCERDAMDNDTEMEIGKPCSISRRIVIVTDGRIQLYMYENISSLLNPHIGEVYLSENDYYRHKYITV